MIVQRKFQIYPTTQQKIIFAKAFGTRRWTWNWAVAERKRRKENNLKELYSYDYDTELNKLIKTNPEKYGWIIDVNSMVKSCALKDFTRALSKISGQKHLVTSEDGTKIYVNDEIHFQKKGKCEESFRMFNKSGKDFNTFKLTSKHVILAWKRGKPMKLLTTENLNYLNHKDIKEITIKKESDKYFIYISYEKTNHKQVKWNSGSKIGLDLGIKHVYCSYDGVQSEIIDLPQQLNESQKRIDKLNKILSKKKYMSNHYKYYLKLLKNKYIYSKNLRDDLYHKLTTFLCQNYETINIDSFSYKSAENLKRARRKLSAVAPSLFKRMLEYKTLIYGNNLTYIKNGVEIATTQTCSCCGHRYKNDEKLTLKDRTFICIKCGLKIDRDVNSAINAYQS